MATLNSQRAPQCTPIVRFAGLLVCWRGTWHALPFLIPIVCAASLLSVPSMSPPCRASRLTSCRGQVQRISVNDWMLWTRTPAASTGDKYVAVIRDYFAQGSRRNYSSKHALAVPRRDYETISLKRVSSLPRVAGYERKRLWPRGKGKKLKFHSPS